MALGVMSALGMLGSSASIGIGAGLSAKYNNQSEEIENTQHRNNQQWYNTKLSQDYTQRSDVQSILTKQREILQDQYENARKRNIVAGGTDESLALQQANANQSLSNTMQGIAENSAGYKDSIENAKLAENQAFSEHSAGLKRQRANNIAQATAQTASAFGNLIGNDTGQWGFLFGGKKAGANAGGTKG